MTLAELLEVYEFKGSDSQATFTNDDDPVDMIQDDQLVAIVLNLGDIKDLTKTFKVGKKDSDTTSYSLNSSQLGELITMGLVEESNLFAVPDHSLTNFSIIKKLPSSPTPFGTFEINFGYQKADGTKEKLGYFTVIHNN